MSVTTINHSSSLGLGNSPFSATLLWKLEYPTSSDSNNPFNCAPPISARRPSRPQVQCQNVSPKRAEHLERNRIAANKCRQRKKREHTQLQETLDAACAKHAALEAEVRSLREEIWHSKNQLFAHAHCDDQQINSRLSEMANKMKGMTDGSFKHSSPPLSMGTPSEQSMVDPGMTLGTENGAKREMYEDGLFDTLLNLPCVV